VDPVHAVTNTDIARAKQLFDSLTTYDASGASVLSLAEEFSPNSDATLWTIRVPKGVTFHNGKELDADDLIYSFQQILNPKSPGTASTSLGPLDVKGIRKRDSVTIQVPFTTPYSAFPEILGAYYAYVIPVGFDPKNPVGTGPFKYQSFTPGENSVFVRFPDYRESGLPYVDQLTITDFSDEMSQVNALLSGQIDGCSISNATLVPQIQQAGGNVVITPSGASTPIIMRTTSEPFTDSRVRQALRLAVDRPGANRAAFFGKGILGDDVVSRFDPAYDTSLPQRTQDIEQAKALLKAAGKENLTVQMVVADVAPGATNLATAVAQQVSSAGITINLKTISTTEYYGSNYGSWPFSIDYYYMQSYLAIAALALGPKAPVPETSWRDPEWDSLYAKALMTTDTQARYQIEHQLMQIEYERGGYVIPAFLPQLDAHGPKVNGVVPSRLGIPFNDFDFKQLWKG
jgi:peptide/nickel transport system substrate-binding protein